MSEPQAERECSVGAERPGSLEAGNHRAFRLNLEQFGDRAARLCQLLRAGRISSESCFRALTQLWLQVAQSRSRAESAEETGESRDEAENQESNIL